MTLSEAVETCFRKYAVFKGRARRSEYWWWALFAFLADTFVNALAGFQPVLVILGRGESGEAPVLSVLAAVVTVVLFLPGLAVLVRRLHDTGRSGWLALIVLIPLIGLIILIVFLVQEGTPESNEYGPSPIAAT